MNYKQLYLEKKKKIKNKYNKILNIFLFSCILCLILGFHVGIIWLAYSYIKNWYPASLLLLFLLPLAFKYFYCLIYAIAYIYMKIFKTDREYVNYFESKIRG